MNISNKNFSSIDQVTRQYLNNQTGVHKQKLNTDKSIDKSIDNAAFNSILKNKQTVIETTPSVLKFSKHANERLEMRNIELSKEQLDRLESGIYKAQEKGIKESLVMMDNLAFIVNVKNNTVVTAVNSEEGGYSTFTNIDGAVII